MALPSREGSVTQLAAPTCQNRYAVDILDGEPVTLESAIEASMTEPPGARKKTLKFWLELMTAALVASLILFWLTSSLQVSDYAPSLPMATPGNSSVNQVKLQSSIVDDRKSLFNGIVSYSDLEPVKVEESAEVEVELIAVGSDFDAAPVPEGRIVGSRKLLVGGVEEARLSCRTKDVEISAIGPAKGLIGRIGDSVTWRWAITPKKAGKHTLDLVIVTYQGNTNNPLHAVNPPIKIEVEAKQTLKSRVNSARVWVLGISTFVVALSGILAFFREPIFKRLSKRRHVTKESTGTEGGDT
ncbi:hypothetical protein HRW16_19350 [Streptomyces lunaelactis]|uniref:hypothetical protein n=1 Tax=Streptomyces lunaelactis TaxID=1535768 RepID=UPI0015844B3B|nr:hypothetical protein [Streptomyces lunaelactis]NUK32521.1 hypothetical protein [Streptomyces lunaelactis]NUK93952.1 hypothetical protein [Streptomyces lunaelactis]NUL30196.1 hypothetical protein [Streptomyces lunaelactis]